MYLYALRRLHTLTAKEGNNKQHTPIRQVLLGRVLTLSLRSKCVQNLNSFSLSKTQQGSTNFVCEEKDAAVKEAHIRKSLVLTAAAPLACPNIITLGRHRDAVDVL